MKLPKKDLISIGEYVITIDYNGEGNLDIMVFDELGEEIEGLFISNADDNDDIETNYVPPSLN